MLRRFVAAALLPACLIWVGAVVLIALRLIANQRYYQMAVLWCLVPVGWGVWAALMPTSWFPRKLFAWGAILGVLAYVLGAIVLNIPFRVTGLAFPLWARIAGFALAAVLYGAAWMLIAPIYRTLWPDDSAATVTSKAA